MDAQSIQLRSHRSGPKGWTTALFFPHWLVFLLFLSVLDFWLRSFPNFGEKKRSLSWWVILVCFLPPPANELPRRKYFFIFCNIGPSKDLDLNAALDGKYDTETTNLMGAFRPLSPSEAVPPCATSLETNQYLSIGSLGGCWAELKLVLACPISLSLSFLFTPICSSFYFSFNKSSKNERLSPHHRPPCAFFYALESLDALSRSIKALSLSLARSLFLSVSFFLPRWLSLNLSFLEPN